MKNETKYALWMIRYLMIVKNRFHSKYLIRESSIKRCSCKWYFYTKLIRPICLLIIKAKCNGKIIPSHNSLLISNGLLGIQSAHHLINWHAYIKRFYDCFWNSNILFVIIRCKLVELLSLFTKFTFSELAYHTIVYIVRYHSFFSIVL